MADLSGLYPLKSGNQMEVWRIEMPCSIWGPRLVKFIYHAHMEYTNCSWHHNCSRVVAGDFAAVSRDVFFVGLLQGQPVGTCWYATPRDTGDLGTLGRVVTSPAHRRQGVSAHLCRLAMADFAASGGWCLHLGTGRTNPARYLYERLGFVHVNYVEGQGTVMRAVVRGGAEAFESDYYAPGQPVRIRPLHWGDFPRAEALYNLPHWLIKDFTLGICANTPFEGQFFELMESLQRRGETGAALVTADEHLVGLAYGGAFNMGAGAMSHVRSLEFLVHPNYASHSTELIAAAASGCAAEKLIACSSTADDVRSEALQKAGFSCEGNLTQALQDQAENMIDLQIYALQY